MKKIILLIMIFLVGCTNTSPVELLELNKNCPNVCWLGVQTGVTSDEEAYDILRKSEYVDRKSIKWNKAPNEWYRDVISAQWLTDPNVRRYKSVDVIIENNKVQSIWFKDLQPITVQELFSIFGSPAEVSVYFVPESPIGPHISYSLFYHDSKIIMHIWESKELSALSPYDIVHELILNQPVFDLSASAQKRYEDAQPWLGYGDLELYLPREEIP
ncbi:MAG TPA: hypothetical protein VJ972_09840 [Anaerolineales bacterium]|nr:hypothetical protein [Anaerolineales bacterium]